MRSIVLLAACLACAGHAREVYVAEEMRENASVPDDRMLAILLLASSPRSAFTLFGRGMHPTVNSIIDNRDPAPQLRTKRGSIPLMIDDAAALQAQVSQLQVQVELLQKQIKIAELQAQLAALRQQQKQGQLTQVSPPAAPKSEHAPPGGNRDRAEHNAHSWGVNPDRAGHAYSWGGNRDRAQHNAHSWGGNRDRAEQNAHSWDNFMGQQERRPRWRPANSAENARNAECAQGGMFNCVKPQVDRRTSSIFMGKDRLESPASAHRGAPPAHVNAIQRKPSISTTEAVVSYPRRVPSADVAQPVNPNLRSAASQLWTKRSRTPSMIDDSLAWQNKVSANIGTGQVASIGAPSRTSGTAANQPQGQSSGKSEILPVQGGSLKTWSYRTSLVERVQVVLSTDGRPLDADVQLWQGPDNTPCKMRVYSEDGSMRPFSTVIATPTDGANTVAIRNVGQMEFPLAAYVSANSVSEPISDFRDTSMIVQGGALRTFEFNPSVESVEVVLKTDGRPLNARIELLQGPNNNKQVIELYTEDGLERPFFAIMDTIGAGNVVRVVNTAPLEFPMFASVQPHSINEKMSLTDPVIGGTART